MKASRQGAAKRGYPMPHVPDETGDEPQTPESVAPSANGAVVDRAERCTAPSRTRRK
jgi:hypothetical protein